MSNIRFLHDEGGNWDIDGQGAGMLSFKSHTKLIPIILSSIASDGKLGKRHPETTTTKRTTNNY